MAEEVSTWLLETQDGFKVLFGVIALVLVLIINTQSSKKNKNANLMVGLSLFIIWVSNIFHLKFGRQQDHLQINAAVMILVIGLIAYNINRYRKKKKKISIIPKIALVVFLLFNVSLLLFNNLFLVSSYPFINNAEILYIYITIITGSIVSIFYVIK